MACFSFAIDTAMHNPSYAGAYAFGRGRFRKQADGRLRHERLPLEQWNLSQDSRAREYWEKAAVLAPDSESGRRAKENLQKLQ